LRVVKPVVHTTTVGSAFRRLASRYTASAIIMRFEDYLKFWVLDATYPMGVHYEGLLNFKLPVTVKLKIPLLRSRFIELKPNLGVASNIV
jgi:hypothetical protein